MDQEPTTPTATAITPGGRSTKTARSTPTTPAGPNNTRTAVETTPTATALSPAPASTASLGQEMVMVPGSPGLAIELSDTTRSESTKTAKETRVHEQTIGKLKTGGLFGKSRSRLSRSNSRSTRSRKSTKTAKTPATPTATAVPPNYPMTPELATAQSGGLQTPVTAKSTRTELDTAITPRSEVRTAVSRKGPTTPLLVTAKSGQPTPRSAPNGLSCKTAKTLRSSSSKSRKVMKTAKSGAATPVTTRVPTTPLATAVTPNGLSCRTARTIRFTMTPMSTPKTPATKMSKGRSGKGQDELETARENSAKSCRSGSRKLKTPRSGMATAKSGGEQTPLQTAITPNGLSCKTAKTLRSSSSKSRKSTKTAKSGAATPATAITPNGLSCKTAKTIQTTPRTGRTGLRTARRSLFPNLKIQEPKSNASSKKSSKSKKSVSFKENAKQPVNSKRSPSRDSVKSPAPSVASTANSFQPPGTPQTCDEIPAHILAEAKAEQNKVVLTSSTEDGAFKVVVQIKMKVVGQKTAPQAMLTKKVTVNGEERFTAA